MDSLALAAARIQEIESRQDDVLRALEALDRQVERLVAECLASGAAPPRTPASADPPPTILLPAREAA